MFLFFPRDNKVFENFLKIFLWDISLYPTNPGLDLILNQPNPTFRTIPSGFKPSFGRFCMQNRTKNEAYENDLTQHFSYEEQGQEREWQERERQELSIPVTQTLKIHRGTGAGGRIEDFWARKRW